MRKSVIVRKKVRIEGCGLKHVVNVQECPARVDSAVIAR